MLKVIGGKYRSRNLLTPGEETIPTKARVREAVASALSFAIPNAEVLDLFAGSGALGIEMLSRGAKRCVFVDADPDAAKVIRENLKTLKENNGEVLLLDYESALKRLKDEGRKFDIVLLDPPYKMRDSYQKAADYLSDNGLLSEEAVIMMEYEGDLDFEIKGAYARAKTYNYGRTKVLILWRQ